MELVEKSNIIERLNKDYGKERVCLVNTSDYDLTTLPKHGNSNIDRSNWADKVVKYLYKINRNSINHEPRFFSTGEYNFTYIKFVKDDKGKIYGAVSGLSCFHSNYPSDVYFYDIPDDEKKQLSDLMVKNHLEWYKDEILIFMNIDAKDRNEAKDNEKKLKKLFNLYD